MLVGQAITGFSRSMTVTVNEQETRLLAASVAVQRTLVMPLGNTDPLGGRQVTVTICELSDAVTVYSTEASQRPDAVAMTRFVGQSITGGSVSLTVTMNEHRLVLPVASVAMQVTGVVPRWNTEPLWGAHT
jgi:hypothetical protein